MRMGGQSVGEERRDVQIIKVEHLGVFVGHRGSQVT